MMILSQKFNFNNRYRVVVDNYSGFEAQVKRWYFPFWVEIWGECFTSNTHSSLSEAKKFIESHQSVKNKTHIEKEIWRDR